MIDLVRYILLCLICYMVVASIHELGHILTGVINGFQFYMFVIGPIGVRRENGNKIRIYFEKNIAFWGGVGGSLPQHDGEDNLRVFSKVLLGGPLVSVILGLILAPLSLLYNNLFLAISGFMSIGIGVASLIPMRAGCFYTDGGRWKRINSGKRDAEVEMAIWNITQTLIIFSEDYERLNIQDIDLLISDADVCNEYLGRYFAYKYYQQRNDMDSMVLEKEHIIKLRGRVPKNYVKMYPIN